MCSAAWARSNPLIPRRDTPSSEGCVCKAIIEGLVFLGVLEGLVCVEGDLAIIQDTPPDTSLLGEETNEVLPLKVKIECRAFEIEQNGFEEIPRAPG